MSTYNEEKKRRIAKISENYNHVPHQGEIVQLLCPEIKETADTLGHDYDWCSTECPKHGAGCTLRWKKGTGWTNPFRKLVTCFGGVNNGGKEALAAAYWVKYDQDKRGENGQDIRDVISYAAGYTPEENAAMDWLVMVIMKNWPLTSVEDPDYRNIIKHKIVFSYKRICMLIFLLGEVVQEKITKLMEDKFGCLIHDGLTNDSMHYIGLYASFIEDEGGEDEKLRMPLLSVSPMPVIANEEEDEAEPPAAAVTQDDDDMSEQDPHYAARFNAKTHVNYFGKVLEDYGHTIASFAVAILADNTEVNKRIAKDCNLPTLPCLNHVHALDISK